MKVSDRVRSAIYPEDQGTVLAVYPEGSRPDTLVAWDGGRRDWCYARTELVSLEV